MSSYVPLVPPVPPVVVANTTRRRLLDAEDDSWIQSPAEYIHSQGLVCIPPKWDNETMWSVYTTQYVDFFIYEKQEWSTDFVLMFAVNGTGQMRRNELPYKFVHINKKPRFVGTRFVTVPGNLDGHTHVNWTTLLRKGETFDYKEITVEEDQPVTYFVSVTDGQRMLFDELPTIDAGGTMAFKSKHGMYGRARIYVYVQDGGGILYGGDDTSLTAAFEVSVMPAADIPTWQIGGVIVVPEDDDNIAVIGNSFYRFLTDLGNGPDEFYQFYTFSAVSDSAYLKKFDLSVNYDYGSGADLFVESPAFVFGDTTVELSLQVRDIRTQLVTTISKNLTVTLIPVNNAPSFSLIGHVFVNETRPGHDRYCMPIAADILKGPNITATGPKGEDWAENNQLLSFDVALINGSSTLLMKDTTVSPDGTLCFTPHPYQNGKVTFSIVVVDNGGSEHGGSNTSSHGAFDVFVLPVNDMPVFSINQSLCEMNVLECPGNCSSTSCADACQAHCVASSGSSPANFSLCISECDLPSCFNGRVSDCSIAISVSQNCADCPKDSPKVPTCLYPFVLEYFAISVFPSFVGSLDEGQQKLSFVLEMAPGSDLMLFEKDPEIDAAGTLTFCILKDQSGNATLKVTLTDDGGTDGEGRDGSEAATLTVSVETVNVRPTFELCDAGEVIVWQSTGAYSIPNFAFDIYRGERLLNDVDVEAEQGLTFSAVVASSTAANPFQNGALSMGINGMLNFTLLPSFAGVYPVHVSATDTGGSERGGVDTSDPVHINFFVVGSYVILDVEVINTGIVPLSGEAVRRNVTALAAHALGVKIAGMARPGGLGVKLKHSHILHLFKGPDCSEADTSTTAPLELITAHGNASFSIVIVSTSSQRTLDYGADTENVTSVFAASSATVSASLVSFSLHTLDIAATGSFVLQDNQLQGAEPQSDGIPIITVKEYGGEKDGSSVTLEVDRTGPATVTTIGNVSSSSMLLSVVEFITNITGPPDVLVDLNGKEMIQFDIVPVAYRLFTADSFVYTNTSSTGGMIRGMPTVSVACTSSRGTGVPMGQCTGASTTLGSIEQYFNGQVQYEVRMQRSTSKAVFVLTILPVNQEPILMVTPIYSMLEAGKDGKNVSVDSFIIFSLGAPVSDEMMQAISFTVVYASALTGHALFESNPRVVPTANGTAKLNFGLAPFRNGDVSFTVTAHDDGTARHGGFNVSMSHNFTIQIIPVNRHPFFYLNCSASVLSCTKDCGPPRNCSNATCADACNRDCVARHGESHSNFLLCNSQCVHDWYTDVNISQCVVDLTLNEDCGNCPDPNGVSAMACPDGVRPLVLPGFMASIQTSFVDSTYESSQTLSFDIIAVNGSSEFLSVGPYINPLNGTLTLCLKKTDVGWIDLQVSLRDSGYVNASSQYASSQSTLAGAANAGAANAPLSYGPISLKITVSEVNQQPTFQVCSPNRIVVWQGSGHHVISGFVHSLLKGDEAGVELEPNQTATFSVTTPNSTILNSSSLSLDSTGALSFQVLPDKHGEVLLNIVAKDNGGTERGGQDTSNTRVVEIVIVGAYLQIDFTSPDSNLMLSDSAITLRGVIANSTGVSVDLVTVAKGAGMSSVDVLSPSPGMSCVYCPSAMCSGNSGQGTRRRLLQNSFSVRILSTSLSSVLAQQQTDPGFASLLSAVQDSFISIQMSSFSLHTKDHFRSVHFDVIPKITVNEFDASTSLPAYVQFRFSNVTTNNNSVAMQEFRFFDIAGQQITPASAIIPGGSHPGSPPHTADLLIDGIVATDGSSKWLDQNQGDVIFEFGSAARVASYEWVTCHDDPQRDPVSWQIEARQATTDAWTLLHSISNYATTSSRNTVVGPFQIFSSYPLENAREGSATVSTSIDIANMGMIVHVTNFINNVVGPVDVEVSITGAEIIVFDVVPVAYRLFADTSFVEMGTTGGLLRGLPSVSVSCAAARGGSDPGGLCTSANITLGLAQEFFNGEVRYEVTMSGISKKAEFVLEILPVNQLPSFEILPVFISLEGAEEVLVPNFGFKLSTGPTNSSWSQLVVDEQNQYLGFNVTLLEGSSSLFSDFPALVSVLGEPNATLVFSLKRGMHGVARFAVTGLDSGPGAPAPGALSKTHTFTLYVLAVNQQPSFRLRSNITVNQDTEDRVVVFRNLAIDIMKDAGDQGEKDQGLFFVLTMSGDPVVASDPAPRLYANGTFVFTAIKLLLGTAHFSVRLQDTGGIVNGGVNSTTKAHFSVRVIQRNYPPVFNVSLPLVRVCENSGYASATVFQGIMAAWHPVLAAQEAMQQLTFDMLPLNQASNLFAAAPSVSHGGVLTFTTALNQFGNATFNVTLRDNAHDVDATSSRSMLCSRAGGCSGRG